VIAALEKNMTRGSSGNVRLEGIKLAMEQAKSIVKQVLRAPPSSCVLPVCDP
jgi:hypothetical protein